jgi:hypothetical protein
MQIVTWLKKKEEKAVAAGLTAGGAGGIPKWETPSKSWVRTSTRSWAGSSGGRFDGEDL